MVPLAACGMLTQMDVTDIYGISPTYFCEAGHNLNLSKCLIYQVSVSTENSSKMHPYRLSAAELLTH